MLCRAAARVSRVKEGGGIRGDAASCAWPGIHWGVMATKTSAKGNRKRKLSKRQRRIYYRRRFVVAIVLVVVLALAVFAVYSLGRGVVMIVQGSPSVEREAVPDPIETTGVKDCTSSEVSLQLVPSATSVAVGGSLDFSASITYTGSGNSCLVDGSDAGRVLTITSGDDEVWRSDACPVDSRMLLMASGDVDTQTITWDTDRSDGECSDDSSAEHVDAGTYVAQLSFADLPDVVSDQVTFTVQ